MFTIYIDGKKYQVEKSSNVLEVCLSSGLDIPYFCWHPVLGSIGSCRQCAVKQYQNTLEDTNGRIVMSCMTPVVDGLIISIRDLEAQEFRKSILELLMTYHPHDCPVCSEGGHCHLQDMTIMTGHHMRRYRFKKRTHINQYLGPFISHEMNRCINCYRCVRYYKDYADGNDLGVYGVHDNLYFGRFQEGQLESEFSGNLIEVCPTGVFTDKTLSQNYSRKWDIQFAPSICTHCSIGCNIIFGERYGKICRVENRYHSNINGYFLCDRGKFGYDYVNNMENRYIRPLKKENKNQWVELNEEEIIQKAAHILKMSKKVVGIGSARASIESNFALRDLVGLENFYLGVNRVEYRLLSLMLHILKDSGIYIPTIKEIENCDVILLLGEDLTQMSPRIALAIRQAMKGDITDLMQEKNVPAWHMNAILSLRKCKKNNNVLFITSIDKTKLDDIASWTYYASLNDQARFGFAVSHVIDHTAPMVIDFDSTLIDKVNIVAHALLNARKPLIISGSNVGNESLISSAANIAKSLKQCGKDVSISFMASSSNSIGLAMIGGSGSLDDICDLVDKENQTIDSMLILETDLGRHLSSERVEILLSKVKDLIVLDHQKLSFHKRSNLIFSSTTLPESDGTLINYEGRAQRFFRVYNPMYYDSSLVILESWQWLYALYAVLHSDHKILCNQYINFDDVIDKIIISLPELSNIRIASPDASFRICGQKLARAPNRYSGRTSMHVDKDVHEPCVVQDKDSMFTFSMEGNNTPDFMRQHIAFVWSPGWNSSQAWNKFQSEIKNNDIFNSGIRCFEYSGLNKNIDWFTNIPIVSKLNRETHTFINTWCIVPYWHIFGSEELSQCSLAIQKCMLKPYVVFNRLDAVRYNFCDKKNINFKCGGVELSLPLIFSDKLTSGYIGLPIGFPDISLAFLGIYVKDIEGSF